MEFIDPAIQNYAELHTTAENELLARLNRYTHTSVLKPRMLSGHLQGRYLSMISCLIKPRNILDIGTYTGYSALCLAEGLQVDGKLYTIDNNEEVMETASRFINESGFAEKISLVKGDALEMIKELNGKVDAWDIVWMDAEKSEYINYYDLLIDKVASGGLIMADNVLWSGKVLDMESLERDKDTSMLDEFNKKVNADPRVENVLLPIRDGIMMIRKI